MWRLLRIIQSDSEEFPSLVAEDTVQPDWREPPQWDPPEKQRWPGGGTRVQRRHEDDDTELWVCWEHRGTRRCRGRGWAGRPSWPWWWDQARSGGWTCEVWEAGRGCETPRLTRFPEHSQILTSTLSHCAEPCSSSWDKIIMRELTHDIIPWPAGSDSVYDWPHSQEDDGCCHEERMPGELSPRVRAPGEASIIVDPPEEYWYESRDSGHCDDGEEERELHWPTFTHWYSVTWHCPGSVITVTYNIFTCQMSQLYNYLLNLFPKDVLNVWELTEMVFMMTRKQL